MRYSYAPLAFAALAAASPMPQGVTSDVSPDSSAPEGCSTNYDGAFRIRVTNVTDTAAKRSLTRRQQEDSDLTITLADGTLTDDEDRTGYIAANSQFQFDSPPQEGAIYTSGFSVCDNGTLALGGSTVWYQCLSGGFYNLYNNADAGQCSEIYINVVDASEDDTVASQVADGQVTATAAATVSQIDDGQIQATTDPARTVSQIPDGQIQATTSAGRTVSQIPDGQIQATTSVGRTVSQIPDGQIQATTSGAAVVSQIPDGQIQAATTSAAPSMGTGVMPAGNGTGVTSPSASVQPFAGSAASFGFSSELFAIAAGVVGVAML